MSDHENESAAPGEAHVWDDVQIPAGAQTALTYMASEDGRLTALLWSLASVVLAELIIEKRQVAVNLPSQGVIDFLLFIREMTPQALRFSKGAAIVVVLANPTEADVTISAGLRWRS